MNQSECVCVSVSTGVIDVSIQNSHYLIVIYGDVIGP